MHFIMFFALYYQQHPVGGVCWGLLHKTYSHRHPLEDAGIFFSSTVSSLALRRGSLTP